MEAVKSADEVAKDTALAIQVIDDTVKLIDKPARWVRGFEATNKRGNACRADAPDGTCFCLYAAMRRTAGTTASDEEGERTPGLRDVHDAIERWLWRRGETTRYQRTNGAGLVIAWNDDCQEHSHLMEVLADAAQAIQIRGRALSQKDGAQSPLRSTGNKDLDHALWSLVATLSTEDEGNSELIDAGEDVLRAWQRWQTTFV